jgi:hypothetical protein
MLFNIVIVYLEVILNLASTRGESPSLLLCKNVFAVFKETSNFYKADASLILGFGHFRGVFGSTGKQQL